MGRKYRTQLRRVPRHWPFGVAIIVAEQLLQFEAQRLQLLRVYRGMADLLRVHHARRHPSQQDTEQLTGNLLVHGVVFGQQNTGTTHTLQSHGHQPAQAFHIGTQPAQATRQKLNQCIKQLGRGDGLAQRRTYVHAIVYSDRHSHLVTMVMGQRHQLRVARQGQPLKTPSVGTTVHARHMLIKQHHVIGLACRICPE